MGKHLRLALQVALLAFSVGQAWAQVTPDELIRRKSGDRQLIEMVGNSRYAVALHYDRIEFFRLGNKLHFDPRAMLMQDGTPVDSFAVEPAAILWLAQKAAIAVGGGENIIVCQDPWFPKGPRDLSDFCGIVNMQGKIVFKFPVKQSSDRILKP
ncbi:MAG: hypothetical protein PHU21_07845 [Elusimicrobia bacterium]|nr:hypothetical protein [Elusimicrobiota bacterium]